MKCREFNKILLDLIDGELDYSTKKEAMNHIENCSECREKYEWEREIFNNMKKSIEDDVEFQSIEDKVMNSINKDKYKGRRLYNMKRNFIKLASVAAILIFAVITIPKALSYIKSIGNRGNENPVVNEDNKLLDYVKLPSETLLHFKGGFENGGEEQYLRYYLGNVVVIRGFNGGTDYIKIFEEKEGKLLVRSFALGGFDSFSDLLKMNLQNNVVLASPIKVGTEWTDTNNNKYKITNTDYDLKIEAGNFKAIEVTGENYENGKLQYITKDYYVKNMGHVKSAMCDTNGTELMGLELKGTTPNCSLSEGINYYYPYMGATDEGVYSVSDTIKVKTNENLDLKTILEAKLKTSPGKGISGPFTKNTKILSLTLKNHPKEPNERVVTLDLSKEFLSEMNAGTTYESLILKSLTNTMTEMFRAGYMELLIEGKPYASGHIALEPDEYLKPDYDDVKPYNKTATP